MQFKPESIPLEKTGIFKEYKEKFGGISSGAKIWKSKDSSRWYSGSPDSERVEVSEEVALQLIRDELKELVDQYFLVAKERMDPTPIEGELQPDGSVLVD